jgi:hypothetical protein
MAFAALNPEAENFVRRCAEKGFHPQTLVKFCRREAIPQKFMRSRIKIERERIKMRKGGKNG